MTTFLIIRHGQSASNAAATLTGQLDIALTETGIKQGQMVSEYIFNNYKVDRIYSSDLIRASSTVQRLSELTGLDVTLSKNLREMNCGEWQGRKVSDLIAEYGEYYERWKDHDTLAFPPKGESFTDLQKRAFNEIERIRKENDGKTIVIATHGGVIKVLTGAFLKLPMAEWKEKLPYVSNASVTKVVFDNDYKIIETVDHYLGDIKTEMPKGI